MRRITILLLAAILHLTSCTNESPPITDDAAPAAFIIGQLGARGLATIHNNREAIVNAAGGILITESIDFTPAGIISAVEILIERGSDGIILTPMAESSLPQVAKICEQAGVYWVISMRSIHNPQVRQIVEASPYFVGSVYQNDEAAGYEIIKILAQNGAKEVALISTSRVDTAIDARERGLNKAADEFDVSIVAEVRNCRTAADVSRAVEHFIDAYPGLDAVFRVGLLVRDASPAALNSIQLSNRSAHIKYASIDFDKSFGEFFEKNSVAAVAGGHQALDASLATAMLVNAVTGNPINENGPLSFSIPYILLSSIDDFEKFYSIVGDDSTPLFTDEQARSMLLKQYNPSLTSEDYQQIIDNYTIDNLNKIFE